MYISGQDFHSVYNSLWVGLMANGATAAPRGHQVLEMTEPTVWTVSNAANWVPNMRKRRLNIFFALAEVVWMWSGNGSVDFISFYNSSIKQFQDGELPYFHGAYGKRVRHAGYAEYPALRPGMPWTTRWVQAPDGSYGLYAGQEDVQIDQIKAVLNKLEDDPSTRQAVISLWDPFKDNLVTGSKDYPCNNLVYSQIREENGKKFLKTTVVMRSNDLVLGTPYNMIQFSHLHALIAGSLDVEMGPYSVMANNLHLYETAYYQPVLQELIAKWRGNSTRQGIYGDDCLFPTPYCPGWDMRWSLQQFDNFVNNTWMGIEQDLRRIYDSEDRAGAESYFQTAWEDATATFNNDAVPVYWRQVFSMLLVWHARKLKFEGWQEWTSAILDTVNPTFRALALDFDPTLQ